jgi:PST family polysaccharide transporter
MSALIGFAFSLAGWGVWSLIWAPLVAITATPLLVGLSAVADDFVLGVLGPQWEGVVVPIRILAFAAVVNCLRSLVDATIKTTEQSYYEVATQASYAVLVVAGMLVGTKWGLGGVAAGI